MNYIDYLKIPYEPFGRSFKGCDCVGLVTLIYETELGITFKLVDYSLDWYKDSPKLILSNYKKYKFKQVDCPQKYDVLVLLEAGLPKHLGIVLDNGNFIHTTKVGTAVHSYVQGKYSQNIVTILRHVKVNPCV